MCTHCGSDKYYARGLCKNCYARMLRRGTPEKHVPKALGRVVNGWEVISISCAGASVKCAECGHVKTVSYDYANTGALKPHTCAVKVRRKLTPRQAEYWAAWEESGRNYASAAKLLGVSRQAVECEIKLCSTAKAEKIGNPCKAPARDINYYKQQLAAIDARRAKITAFMKKHFQED